MKKRILFVMMNLYNGGAEKSLINLLNVFDYTKYSVDLLLFQQKGLFLNQIPIEVNLIKIPKELKYLYNNIDKEFFKDAKNIKYALIRLLGVIYKRTLYKTSSRKTRQLRWKLFYNNNIKELNEQYEVAIAYLECEPTYYVINKVNARKKIIWVHNDYIKTGLDYNLDFKYMEKADKIITISDECVEILKRTFSEFSNKIECLPNLICNKTIIEKADQKCTLEFKENAFKILSIGRLNEQKGFELAIEAANILQQNDCKFQWIILGDGELKEKLKIMIKKYKLQNIVLLLGSRSNPYPYIKHCDLFVQSSLYEGKSVVLDEAKILNTPILATNYDTVNDQLNNKISMIVSMNPYAIAEGIFKLMKNPKQLNEYKDNMSKNSYDNIHEIVKYYSLIEEK